MENRDILCRMTKRGLARSEHGRAKRLMREFRPTVSSGVTLTEHPASYGFELG